MVSITLGEKSSVVNNIVCVSAEKIFIKNVILACNKFNMTSSSHSHDITHQRPLVLLNIILSERNFLFAIFPLSSVQKPIVSVVA